MKKLFTLILVMSMTILSYAQEEHLQFKGISMGMTTAEMVSKLKSQGFVVNYNEDGTYMLKGDFAGKKECTVVLYPGVNKQVRLAMVVFPEKTIWSTLRSDFDDLAKTLTEKYGKPTRFNRDFEYPYELGDGDEMYAISAKKVSYSNIYETPTGSIVLLITSSTKRGSASVSIGYTDKINSEMTEAAENAKAYDDL